MSQHKEAFLGSIEESPSKVFYLTKVSYNETRHEVLVEFSNSSSRVVERYKFFPFTQVSLSFEKDKFEDLILSLGFKGFSLEEERGIFCLKSLSFSELKKISNALARHIGKLPLVLAPERAFLLSKNWSYFDAFEKLSDAFYKIDLSSQRKDNLSEFNLGFFLTKEISFSEALKMNKSDALYLVELASWSNLLSVPINLVPKEKESKIELFIENIFFKNGELISFEESKRVYSNSGFEPLGGESLSKLDFSLVWAELFTNTFFNIGPETRNCSCCVPVVLDAKNLLPSSLIKVRFLDDNLFFESVSDCFSVDFHSEMPFKDQRVLKRREFFTNSFPVGPFFKDDSASVPLVDAKRLISAGKAVLVSTKDVASDSVVVQKKESVHELNWFCLNKESFFSKEVRFSSSFLFGLRKRIDSLALGLFASENFSFYYFNSLYSSLSVALASIPVQLTNPNSKFFSTSLAKNILSVQDATIAKFKEFSENEGYRVLHANSTNAFVKGHASLKLAKDFASKTHLPQPQIAGFSTKRALGFA